MGLRINKKSSLIPKIIGWSSLIIVSIAMIKTFAWEQGYYKNKSAEIRKEAKASLSKIESIDHPDESDISAEDFKNFRGPQNEPRYLRIPRLGIEARIIKSDMTRDTLPVAQNIHDVSWYAASPIPSKNGVTVISGLIEGPSKDAVFHNLDSLEHGDQIEIENNEGIYFVYEVAQSRHINAGEGSQELGSIQEKLDDTETLSLVSTHYAKQSSAEDQENFSDIVLIRAKLSEVHE